MSQLRLTRRGGLDPPAKATEGKADDEGAGGLTTGQGGDSLSRSEGTSRTL